MSYAFQGFTSSLCFFKAGFSKQRISIIFFMQNLPLFINFHDICLIYFYWSFQYIYQFVLLSSYVHFFQFASPLFPYRRHCTETSQFKYRVYILTKNVLFTSVDNHGKSRNLTDLGSRKISRLKSQLTEWIPFSALVRVYIKKNKKSWGKNNC